MRMALLVSVARRSRPAALLLTAMVVAGCAPAPGVDRSQLVTDLALRLSGADALTYTAEYEIGRGATATVWRAQDPARLAVAYGAMKIMISVDGATACVPAGGRMRCTDSLEPSGSPTLVWPTAATGAGLPDPGAVMARLVAASTDPTAVIERHETTLVGRQASCVSVSGLASGGPFRACVTSDGILGSFAGAVGDRTVEITLIRFQDSVADDAFDPPADANPDRPIQRPRVAPI